MTIGPTAVQVRLMQDAYHIPNVTLVHIGFRASDGYFRCHIWYADLKLFSAW
jgi:hypothetical protein